MWYSGDFKTTKVGVEDTGVRNSSAFSVTWNNITKKNGFRKYNFTNAARPIVYFATLFGKQMIRYQNYNISKVKPISKLFCCLFICAIISLMTCVRPISWVDTKSDLPLNILTKTYGFLHTVEVIYSIVIVSFRNSIFYVDLFKTIDSIDGHYGISKGTFIRGRITAWILILLPILQVLCTFWLRKFHINNTVAHLTFFLIVLQGAVIVFFVVHLYMKLIVLNMIIVKKISKGLTPQKMCVFEDSTIICFKKVFADKQIIERTLNGHFCWYELMQIYDKISESIRIFNQIYAGQVFIMFISWLVCTLLTICRSLSPTVKYSDVIINDLFMYLSINYRPIFLAKMCELFMKERRKTLSLLLYSLVHGIDDMYGDQVQTMIDLVTSKKLEVYGSVFVVDLPSVLEFSGRAVSYTVLMIQYFYTHAFSKL